MFELHIVLFEPEIPQNTGNIIRTCAALGAGLHLIRPLGFSLESRYLKRAGMDYRRLMDLRLYDDYEAFLKVFPGIEPLFFSKKASRVYDEADYSGRTFLVFGSESSGVPEEVLARAPERNFRIPMREEARSLNLAAAVAVAAYEAARRNRFPGLAWEGRSPRSEP